MDGGLAGGSSGGSAGFRPGQWGTFAEATGASSVLAVAGRECGGHAGRTGRVEGAGRASRGRADPSMTRLPEPAGVDGQAAFARTTPRDSDESQRVRSRWISWMGKK